MDPESGVPTSLYEACSQPRLNLQKSADNVYHNLSRYFNHGQFELQTFAWLSRESRPDKMSDWSSSFHFSLESHNDSISKFMRILWNECSLLWLQSVISNRKLLKHKIQPTIAARFDTGGMWYIFGAYHMIWFISCTICYYMYYIVC